MGAEAVPPPFSFVGGVGHTRAMKRQPLHLNRRQLVLSGAMTALAAPTLATTLASAEPGGDTLELWPAGAPGGERVTVREELVERLPDGPLRDRFAQHVTRPMLTLFKPESAWNGVTLLI